MVTNDGVPEATATTIVAEDRSPAVSEQTNSQPEYKLYVDFFGTGSNRVVIRRPLPLGQKRRKPGATRTLLVYVSNELPLGSVSFECATIEAKLSSALAGGIGYSRPLHISDLHTGPISRLPLGPIPLGLDKVKETDKMCEYAEKYRIGILVVFISKQQYDELTLGDVSNLILDSDAARIETLWPAFYESVQTPALNEYVTEVLEISKLSDLQRFGFE